jgi:tetratricopeptide (TPR) repeat protein
VAQDISARRVFIASPSGLDDERSRLRETIAVYNELNSFDKGVAFVACGWEPTAGTIDRPQAAINPLLRACDFMVMLIWDRWGSASGGSLGFSSGTEEEFAEAVRALSDADSTLRDILIIFKAVSGNQMRDPGPQLAKVLDFRSALESSREVLFHTVDTMGELVTRFETGLRSWAKPLGAKEPKVLKLQTSAPAVVQAAAAAATAMAPRDLLDHAESLAASGQLTQAEAVFSRAIDSRDPAILLRFARFLRRTGRLDRSYEIDHDVVDLTVLSREGEAKALGAEALANMGVVRRKQGKLLESRAHLREAVATARAAGLPGRPVLGYAMDNLAWTDLRLGDFEDARRLFSDSLQLRRDAGDKRGEAQSMINLARTEKMLNRLRSSTMASMNRHTRMLWLFSARFAWPKAITGLPKVC